MNQEAKMSAHVIKDCKEKLEKGVEVRENDLKPSTPEEAAAIRKAYEDTGEEER